MNSQRRYSPLDRLLMGVDASLRGQGHADADQSARAYPAAQQEAPRLSRSEARHAAGLMRVNHAGEVAAQALYLGQAAAARNPATRAHMLAAAGEEQDHLRWCEQRLTELDAAPSRLSPLWYAGAYAIGSVAGAAGDARSLGFVAETERQVSEHLQGHLQKLPERDLRSRSVVQTMRSDEERHGAEATAAGGQQLPAPVRGLMRASARVMTRLAYWL